MSRIRTIKPEFWRHEDLSALPEATHMLAAALLTYADDHGYFNANPKLVQAECCPLREPLVSIPESLRSLCAIGYIRLGTAPDGKRYGHIVHFSTHQRVSHPTPSKISDIAIAWDDSGNSPEPLVSPPETFGPEQGTGKGKEQGKDKGAGAPSSRFAFAGSVVKLTAEQLALWEENFSNLHVRAELTSRDAWLASVEAKDSDRRNWFVSTANHLARKNREAPPRKSNGQPAPPVDRSAMIRAYVEYEWRPKDWAEEWGDLPTDEEMAVAAEQIAARELAARQRVA